MKKLLVLLVAVGCFDAAGCAAETPRPGQTPSGPQQLAQMKSARRQLAAALRKQDPAGIAAAEGAFRLAIGDYAGVPEATEELKPKGAKAPRPTEADHRKLAVQMATLGSGSVEAKAYRMELRRAALLAVGLLALAEADPASTEAHRAQAVVELDFLIAKQAATGYFPYPADPDAPPHLRKFAAKAAAEHPDKVKGGYLYLDADGAQFDAGCCGYALAYGYQVLKLPRLLTAARKAGDWAVGFPLSPNWNYNSFSVWQLAKLYEVTKEREDLDAAVRIAKLGVLPGQMESGRWSDQHNAKAVYHWVMVRALAALVRVVPADEPEAKFLRGRTELAVQSRVEDILRDGASGGESAYAGLAEALDAFGPREDWERALAEVGGVNPYTAGLHARRTALRK